MAGATLSEGRGPILLAITWTWAGIATVLYVLRARHASVALETRRTFLGVRWDFVWVTIAFINAMCAEVFLTVSVLNGTGNHQRDLTLSQGTKSAFWSWIGQVCAIFALVWGRFAVIAFLVALQGNTHRTWKRLLLTVGTIQFLINTAEVALILKQCTPTRKLWDQNVPGTCNLIDMCSKVGFLQGSVGAFSDLFLALYPPAVIIGPLQKMKWRIKVALCLIMGGGVVAGAAGIVKTIQIASITQTDDISYATLNLLIMVLTEMWFIIIFGSLPTIRNVFLSAGQRVRSLAGISRESKHRSYECKDQSWIELSNKEVGSQASAERNARQEQVGQGSGQEHGSSERRNSIFVTTGTTVQSA